MRGLLLVTKSGGCMVICEFSQPTNGAFRKVCNEYLMKALPKVAGAVTRNGDSYEYRNLSGGIVALHRATRLKS